MRTILMYLSAGFLPLVGQSDFSTLYNKGVEEIGKKNYRGAEVLFSKALELKPDYAEARFARGTCFLMLEERDEACADFTLAERQGWKPASDYLRKYCAPGVYRPQKKQVSPNGRKATDRK